MAYTTAAKVAARIGKDAADPDIADAVAQVDQVVDDWCNRTFGKASASRDVHVPDRGRRLVLGNTVSGTEVRTRPNHAAGDDWALLTASMWALEPPKRVWPPQALWTLPGAPPWPSAPFPVTTVRVTGVFGWGTVPEPVQRAAAYWAVALTQEGSVPLVTVEGDIDSGRTNAFEWVSRAKRLLEPYRMLGAA